MLTSPELSPEQLARREMWRTRFFHVAWIVLLAAMNAVLSYFFATLPLSKIVTHIFLWTNIGCGVGAVSLALLGRKYWAYGLVIITIPLMFGIVIGLSLSHSPHQTRAWTEDVLLDDSTTIQVKRTVAFTESDSATHEAYNAVETESTIAFTGELANLPPWSQPLMALVLYQDKTTNEWVVVATTTSCQVWNRRSEPEPMYWEFRLNNQGWRETPLSQTSAGRSANLLHRYQSELKTKHVTVQFREALESDPGIGKEYREILADDKTNCTKALKR